jgi:hypothetical protein
LSLKTTVDGLLFRTWWTYTSGRASWIEVCYHGFNLFEGTAWLILSGLALRRFLRYRRSRVEVAYALAFFTFGLTDFREAYALDSWLIWLKAANLVVLIRLRSLVMSRHYPRSNLY